MKKIKKVLLAVLFIMIIPCCFLFAGCTEPYVTSIKQTGRNGTEQVYTVYYSDGTYESFSVENGKDGKDGEDGEDVSILDAYNTYKQIYGEDITYKEFLNKYLYFSSKDNSVIINDVLQSCFKVYTEFYEGNVYQGNKQVMIYTGSGVIYKMYEDVSYIITNYHVVYDEKANSDNDGNLARNINGYLYGSEYMPVKSTEVDQNGYETYDYGTSGIKFELVGASAMHDIAILKANTQDILNINPNAKAVTLAESYHVGQTAIAIGNPNDEGLSVTEGIVSVDNENIQLSVDGTSRTYRSIRIDTALYSGNSGGGLFNSQGELIGIANAGDGDDQNVNYAIPLEIVTGAADNIIYYYKDQFEDTFGAYKIVMGVTVTSSNSKYVLNQATGYGSIYETITVSAVNQNSIAEKLGLQLNDVVKSLIVNSKEYEIKRNFNISDIILTMRAGNQIKFKVQRDGQEVTTNTYTLQTSDFVSYN